MLIFKLIHCSTAKQDLFLIRAIILSLFIVSPGCRPLSLHHAGISTEFLILTVRIAGIGLHAMKIQCALKRIYTSAVRNLREIVLIIITGSLGIARKKSSFEKLLFLAEDMGLEPTGLLHLT